MSAVQGTLTQLTFDVVDPEKASDPDADVVVVPEPSLSTFAFKGDLHSRVEQRFLKDKLKVVVFDEDGTVVATSNAVVENVRFPLHRETQQSAEWTERAHTLRLVDPNDSD